MILQTTYRMIFDRETEYDKALQMIDMPDWEVVSDTTTTIIFECRKESYSSILITE